MNGSSCARTTLFALRAAAQRHFDSDESRATSLCAAVAAVAPALLLALGCHPPRSRGGNGTSSASRGLLGPHWPRLSLVETAEGDVVQQLAWDLVVFPTVSRTGGAAAVLLGCNDVSGTLPHRSCPVLAYPAPMERSGAAEARMQSFLSFFVSVVSPRLAAAALSECDDCEDSNHNTEGVVCNIHAMILFHASPHERSVGRIWVNVLQLLSVVLRSRTSAVHAALRVVEVASNDLGRAMLLVGEVGSRTATDVVIPSVEAVRSPPLAVIKAIIRWQTAVSWIVTQLAKFTAATESGDSACEVAGRLAALLQKPSVFTVQRLLSPGMLWCAATRLNTLDLSGIGGVQQSLAGISQCVSLRSLILNGTAISDADLALASKLPQLECLSINRCDGITTLNSFVDGCLQRSSHGSSFRKTPPISSLRASDCARLLRFDRVVLLPQLSSLAIPCRCGGNATRTNFTTHHMLQLLPPLPVGHVYCQLKELRLDDCSRPCDFGSAVAANRSHDDDTMRCDSLWKDLELLDVRFTMVRINGGLIPAGDGLLPERSQPWVAMFQPLSKLTSLTLINCCDAFFVDESSFAKVVVESLPCLVRVVLEFSDALSRGAQPWNVHWLLAPRRMTPYAPFRLSLPPASTTVPPLHHQDGSDVDDFDMRWWQSVVLRQVPIDANGSYLPAVAMAPGGVLRVDAYPRYCDTD